MQNLPTAEVYEKEAAYMPWGILIDEVEKYCTEHIPQKGAVLDLLCGTGNLLGRLKNARPDLLYAGVDLEPEYIAYAKEIYPEIKFEVADALGWNRNKKYDAVLCTGGLHHLPYDKQESFIKKIAGLMKVGGFAIVADPYIDDYATESERKVAAAKLGDEYIQATALNHAPEDILLATHTIKENDVSGIEYKNSIQKTRPLFEKYFTHLEMHKTWPKADTAYGDYYFILRK